MAQLLASLRQGKNVLYFLLILTGAALLFYGYKVAKGKAKGDTEDKIKGLYLKTLKLMAQHQLVKARSMTAQQFADVIATARPELSANFCAISNGFAQLSYQNFADDTSQQERDKQLIKLQLSYRQLRWQLWLAKLGIG
jgi:hypothetical protein